VSEPPDHIAPQPRARDGGQEAPAAGPVTPHEAALEAALGHHFARPELLMRALTHRSYVHEAGLPALESNERLEFLGDAVLGFIAADLLFTRAPAADEGALSTVRAALIRASTLATFARRLGLGAHLRLGRGHEVASLRDRVWASTFEAVLGALYLDGGLVAAQRFVAPLLLAEAERALASGQLADDKSLLQHLAQTQLGQTPTYRLAAAEGPAHEPLFAVEVLLGERVLARGTGRSKRQAEQAAARRALEDPGWLTGMTAEE
jgi:ribonuclease-3